MVLFELLAGKFPDHSAAAIAAILDLSRQAYSQAIKRGRLSDAAALRAAALLEMDPGAALLANATGQHPTPPVNNPAPKPADETAETRTDITNYANCYCYGNTKIRQRFLWLTARRPELTILWHHHAANASADQSSCPNGEMDRQ